jgi:nitrogen-specific signal transduction histidine kinase
VELKLEEALPPVVLDWEQLGQVVLHLVNTASGSMPEGGRLVLSTKVACESGRLFAKLRLEDTRGGTTPEARDKLFEPFFSTGPEGQGMCLGLAACRSIVEAHRGSFKAEVGQDRWVAFTIKLPLRGEGRPFRRLADSIIPLK